MSFGTALGWREDNHDSLRYSNLPRHVVKFSPLHLINFYPTLQVAYEFRLKNNFALQADLGYVLSYKINTDPEFKDKRGVKLKTEVRYYLLSFITSHGAWYLSAEPYINIINFDRQTVQTECFDLDCTIQYRRWYDFKVKYREQGIAFKYGIHRYAGKITLDMNIGLVLRHVDYKKPNIPRGFNEPDEWGWFEIPNEEKRTVIGPTVGFRLGYKLQ